MMTGTGAYLLCSGSGWVSHIFCVQDQDGHLSLPEFLEAIKVEDNKQSGSIHYTSSSGSMDVIVEQPSNIVPVV